MAISQTGRPTDDTFRCQAAHEVSMSPPMVQNLAYFRGRN